MTHRELEQSRAGAVLDLAIVLAVMVGVKQSLLPFTMLWAGPASTFSAMAVATYLLHRRGMGWSDLGLVWPQNWLKTSGWVALIFVVFLATVFGLRVIADMFFEDVGTSGRFDFVVGNLPAYLMMLAVVWTHGSFFEELLFRAFLITKGETALGGGAMMGLVAVVGAAVFFGYRHAYYQGMYGAIVTGGIGLLFGLIYWKFGRDKIVPLIIVHGLVNTIGQTGRFLGDV